MAELADAADLKSAGLKRPVGVRVPLSAPIIFSTFRAQRGSPIVAIIFAFDERSLAKGRLGISAAASLSQLALSGLPRFLCR